jgi:PhzF family phenazine biosynthesis protein
MKIPVYFVDAFSKGPFTGNPAAICPLQEWLPDSVMQSIAAEHNLSETAFVVPFDGDYHIRWFTPTVEVDLCGHATLAAAFVLFRGLTDDQQHIRLFSRSGWLEVQREHNGNLTLDFPDDPIQVLDKAPPELVNGLGVEIIRTYKGKFDLLVVVRNQTTVTNLKPDLKLLATLPFRGIIVTASGEESDFVSRFFGPACGVDEDPVTGSAHCTLTHYWHLQTGQESFSARQLSARGGWIRTRRSADRILISGNCNLYLEGTIQL